MAPAKPEPKENTKPKNHLVIDVYDLTGKVVGQETLNKDIFGKEVSPALLLQALRVLQANQRQGTVGVKGRAQVRGGGRKPWRQKGTGRARQGSIRSPQWRGGGVVHGPVMKDWGLDLSKKQRRMALFGAFTQKAVSEEVVLIDKLKISEGKTKELAAVWQKLPLKKKTLVLLADQDDLVLRSARNLASTQVDIVKDVNTLEILKADNLVVTRETLQKMDEFFLNKEVKTKTLPETVKKETK